MAPRNPTTTSPRHCCHVPMALHNPAGATMSHPGHPTAPAHRREHRAMSAPPGEAPVPRATAPEPRAGHKAALPARPRAPAWARSRRNDVWVPLPISRGAGGATPLSWSWLPTARGPLVLLGRLPDAASRSLYEQGLSGPQAGSRSAVPTRPRRGGAGGQRATKRWVPQGDSRAPRAAPQLHPWGAGGWFRGACRTPAGSLPPRSPREVAGGCHHPQEGPGHQPGRARRQSLDVPLPAIRLALCQEEAAAWRDASAF